MFSEWGWRSEEGKERRQTATRTGIEFQNWDAESFLQPPNYILQCKSLLILSTLEREKARSPDP